MLFWAMNGNASERLAIHLVVSVVCFSRVLELSTSLLSYNFRISAVHSYNFRRMGVVVSSYVSFPHPFPSSSTENFLCRFFPSTVQIVKNTVKSIDRRYLFVIDQRRKQGFCFFLSSPTHGTCTLSAMSNYRNGSVTIVTIIQFATIAVLSFVAAFVLFQYTASSSSSNKTNIPSTFNTPHIVIKAEQVTFDGNKISTKAEPGGNAAASAVVKKNYAPQLQVKPALCKTKSLFGREHNGGWFVCGDELPNSAKGEKCIIYSYGLGADWSFDNAAEVEAGCEVHGFDPSGLLWRQGMHGRDYSGIDYAAQYPSKKKTFHNWGLGVVEKALYPIGTVPQEWPGLGDPQLSKSNSEPWLLKSIQQTMIDLGHADSGLSILKIDTEGSEWDAITAFFSNENILKMIAAGRLRQLLIEWHWDPDSTARNQRHAMILRKVEELGFHPWYVNRHEGSECCLDVSYVWRPNNLRRL